MSGTTRFLRFPVNALLLLGALFLPGDLPADPRPPGQDAPPSKEAGDAYIDLYRLRVGMAEATAHRQKALLDLARDRYDRGKRLYPKGAMSQEEFATLLSELKVAESDVFLGEKKILEAKGYLRIIEAVAKSGQPISLCISEME